MGRLGDRIRGLLSRVGNTLEPFAQGAERAAGGIGNMLAAAGGRYAPSDLDLTDAQKRGLLSASINDRLYGPGAPTSPQAQPYLDNIRRGNEFARINQERTDLQDAITNSSLLTQPMKDLYGNAPMEQQQGLLNDISSRNYGAGARSTFGTGQQIFLDKTTQQRKVGQLGSAGGILLDGVLYNAPGSPALPSNYQYLGTTLAYDPDTAYDVSAAGAEGTVVGETTGLLSRYSHPDFAQEEGAYEATIAEMVAQAQSDVSLEEGIKTAKIDRLNGLLDDFNTSWSRTQNQDQQTERMNSLIDRAAEQAGFFTTGFMGALLDGVPGTPAYDLAATVMTLEANLGFDKLQAMRAASPTGGALGQVSERELALLTSAIANLKTGQSQSQFLANLEIIKQMGEQTWKNIDEAFMQDYGVSYFSADAKGTITDFIESEQQRILSGQPSNGADDPQTRSF